MYYTDLEARAKQCPIRSDKNTKVLCVGSDCIAWVWHHKHTGTDLRVDTPPQPDWIGICGEMPTQ